jgi:hypothetical protein
MSSPGVHLTIRPILWLAIIAIALVFGVIFFLIGIFVAPLKTLILALLALFGLAVAPFVILLRLSRRW